jgi:hypothetical protein
MSSHDKLIAFYEARNFAARWNKAAGYFVSIRMYEPYGPDDYQPDPVVDVWEPSVEVMAGVVSYIGRRPEMSNDQAKSKLDQPPPIPNDKPSIWSLVRLDMEERYQVGIERYGTPLQPFNGRDQLKDAYAEALDLVQYLRAAIYERDGE